MLWSFMLTFSLIILIVLSTSAGDIFISRGMKKIGEISTLQLRRLVVIARQIIISPFFLAGLLLMAISYFSFLAALSMADMSFVVPATSISFVFATLGARVYLKEQINKLRWIGTFLVCIGVALISF
jgi:bacterial/archaeal transporter family protein